MDLLIKGNGYKARQMDMEDLFIIMEINTLVCGKMIKQMGGEYHIKKMRMEKAL
jgi:hypothetical protein